MRAKDTLVDLEDKDLLVEYAWQMVGSRLGYLGAWSKMVKGRRHRVSLHRLIAERIYGPLAPGVCVDHINGDPLDNRRTNLRLASRRQNNMNSAKRSTSKCSYKGVSYVPNHSKARPWLARIIVNKKNIFLGHFTDELSAAKTYDEAAKIHFGEFARLNFPGVKT
jgi:hypothetical protein